MQHTVSIGQPHRVYHHVGSMLQVVEPSETSVIKALFNRELNKLSLPVDCIEYLMHNSKLALNADKTLARVYFDFDQSTLTNESKKILNRIVSLVKSSDSLVKVEGHTDSTGTSEYNLSLGLDRAHTTLAYLIKQGAEETHLKTGSFGESSPIASNATKDNRKLNRRVEVKVKE